MKSLILVNFCLSVALAAPWPNQQQELDEQIQPMLENRRRLQTLSVKLLEDRDDDDDRQDDRRDDDDRYYVRREDRRYREGRDRENQDSEGRDREGRDREGRDKEGRDREGRDREFRSRGGSRYRESRYREDDRSSDDRRDREDREEDRYDDRRDRREREDREEDRSDDRREPRDQLDKRDLRKQEDQDRDGGDADEQLRSLRSSHLDALARQMDLVAMKYGSQGRVKVSYIPPIRKSALSHDLGSLNFRYIPSRSREQLEIQPLVKPMWYIPRPAEEAANYNQYAASPLRRPKYQARDDDDDDDDDDNDE